MKDITQSTGHNAVSQAAFSRRPEQSSVTAGANLLMRRFSVKSLRTADTTSYVLALLSALFGHALIAREDVVLSLRVSARNLVIAAALLAVWRLIFWITGLHSVHHNASRVGLVLRAPVATTLATLPVAASLRFSSIASDDIAGASIRFWIISMVLMALSRAALYTYQETVRPVLRTRRNVIVVGTGSRARAMTQQLLAHPDFDYTVYGFVDYELQQDCDGIAPFLGELSQLENILMRNPVDEVLLALPLKSSFSQVETAVAMCGHAGVKTLYSVDLFHTDIAKTRRVDENSGVQVIEMVHSDSRLILKDLFDRTAALLGIVFLLPAFAVIALAIKLTSKGPVFFRQERCGRNKRTFGMLKFRSMVVDAERRMAALEEHNELDGPMFKMKNDPRVTRVGQFLRRTSLDELPQLFNVLKGDMSLVGPRPLPNRDLAHFSEPWLMRRFSVKPGISGLWQVSGRSETDFNDMIRLDLDYIDRWNLPLDIKILARTVNVVLTGKGAY